MNLVAQVDWNQPRPDPCHPVLPATPTSPEPPSSGEEPLVPPESEALPLSSTVLGPLILGPLGLGPLGLDRLGLTEAMGGLALGLIALFSSYDHITFAGYTLHLEQQLGIPFIAASVATVVVDAQLASRSRLRAAQDAARAADEAARERYFASEERQRADRRENQADRERNRAAEARERQGESLERLHQAAVLRLQTFLALIREPLPPGEGSV